MWAPLYTDLCQPTDQAANDRSGTGAQRPLLAKRRHPPLLSPKPLHGPRPKARPASPAGNPRPRPPSDRMSPNPKWAVSHGVTLHSVTWTLDPVRERNKSPWAGGRRQRPSPLCLYLLEFRSFGVDVGGGGLSSPLHLLPGAGVGWTRDRLVLGGSWEPSQEARPSTPVPAPYLARGQPQEGLREAQAVDSMGEVSPCWPEWLLAAWREGSECPTFTLCHIVLLISL